MNVQVDVLRSDDSRTLMARGEHSKETVIAAAIDAEEIDESYREHYEKGELVVGWYRATPRDGFSTYYYPAKERSRGAFLATCVIVPW
jgi:hypothetical protein